MIDNIKNNIYKPGQFGYTYDFQTEIIVSCIQNSDFFIQAMLEINPLYFETVNLRTVFASIKKYYTQYTDIPDKTKLIEYIPNKFKNENIIDTINTIYDYRMLRQSEIEFIRDSVIGFAKHQAMKEAIILSMNKLEDPNNYPEILENIQKALSVGSMIEDIGTIGYDVKQVKERFISRNSNTDIKRIPTGFSELDHVLGGGIGSSEFGTIAGTAKSGKSTFLVNIGANILLLKKNVLYITLEMEEDRIMNKFDMRLLGMTKEEIRLPGSLKRMKDIHNNIGNLIVKSFPEYTLKPCDLEVYLNKLKLSYNFMPDIVLVDYADIMAPNTHYNQKRFEIDDIYYNLSSISKKNKLSIITATQTNRESIKKLESGEILDKDSIAESYGISRICCYLFTINSTPADLKQNKIILYIAANRFGEDGIKIKLHANLSTCTIRDLVSTDRKFFN